MQSRLHPLSGEKGGLAAGRETGVVSVTDNSKLLFVCSLKSKSVCVDSIKIQHCG